MRINFILAAIAISAISLSQSWASDIRILSTNALHLGNDNSKIPGYKQTKYGYFSSEIAATAADVALFQEVMPSEPSITVKSVTPSSFAAYPDPLQSNHFKGFNQQKSRAYVEAYLFVADPKIVICHVTLQNADLGLSSTPNVIRPPDLLLVSKGKHQLWIANFHAIWGKRVGERVSELNAVLDYATSKLITTTPGSIHSSCNRIGGPVTPVTKIVLAGDFNLSVEQINNQIQNRQGWKVLQDADSTLNLQGMLSSSYDHFMIFNIDPSTVDVDIRLACDRKLFKANCYSYRTNTSDHIGVLLTIK